MTKCTKEKLVVETEKGTYILPSDKAAGQCAAEQKCLDMGGILAPITDKTDFEAIKDAISSCEFHKYELEDRYIGLSISTDNSYRVFSNGVEFNKDLHGDLYEENEIRTGNCPGAFLMLHFPEKLQIGNIWRCYKENFELRYVCFKPKKSSKSQAVTSNGVGVNSSLLIFGGLCFVAFACLVALLTVKIKKLTSKISQLASSVA